ncbi:MAG: glycosyltransferase family 4 protein [Ghiorsea sp.]
MKVLIIGLVWPEPESTGASIRIMEHINLYQSQNWDITFACPAVKNEAASALNGLGIQTTEILVNDKSFDGFISYLQPDIVLFDRFLMEEQFGWRVAVRCPTALRMIETIDLHCLREARHQQFKRTHAVALIPEQRELNNEIALREIASIYRSDLSIIISDYEHALLQSHFGIPERLLHLCPFMLNKPDASNIYPFESRQHFISIGNFRHAPNWDAVLWMKEEIWPLIRTQLPQAELHIYGAYTPPKATDLNNIKEGFIIKDRAENVQDVMQAARVCLAPLRFGAGIKTKLADAMLSDTPSVTTSIGTEGMTGGLSWAGTIADDPHAFTDAAIELYQNKELWLTSQQNGFNILSTLFNHENNQQSLLQRILDAKENLEMNRQNNFMGQILNHHYHRSTEFMSRWIEAKNH